MKRILCILYALFFIGCSETNSAQTKKDLSMRYFESENFKNLSDGYLVKSVEIDQQNINIDLNFENSKPTDNQLNTLNLFLNQISKIIKINETKIRSEFESSVDNDVNEYISHHLSEIPKDELHQLIDYNNKSKSDRVKLFEKIKLTRIGIYPQDHELYAIFDYTIGEKYTNYLIVITTDKDGKIIDITTES